MKKKFDCVAMKHAAQDQIRREVKGMTLSQEIAYFREAGKELQKKIQAAHRQHRKLRASK